MQNSYKKFIFFGKNFVLYCEIKTLFTICIKKQHLIVSFLSHKCYKHVTKLIQFKYKTYQKAFGRTDNTTHRPCIYMVRNYLKNDDFK